MRNTSVPERQTLNHNAAMALLKTGGWYLISDDRAADEYVVERFPERDPSLILPDRGNKASRSRSTLVRRPPELGPEPEPPMRRPRATRG